MAVCGINVVKTMVLEIFSFFHLVTNLVSPGRVLGYIFVSFGDLGATFSDFGGSKLEMLWFQGVPGGGPKLRQLTKWPRTLGSRWAVTTIISSYKIQSTRL